MKLIYICGGDVSVYESQVLELLTYLQSHGIDVTLMQGYKHQAEMSALEAKMKKHDGVNVVWFKSKPVYGFMERSQERQIYRALTSIPDYSNAVVHVRSEYLGYIIKQIFIRYNIHLPLLIDIRGVVYEELRYRIIHTAGIRKLLNRVQLRFYRHFYPKLFSKDSLPIALSSVSPLINAYITNNYPECVYRKVFHPNIAGDKFVFTQEGRQEIRKKYGFAEDELVVICSSNGGSVWQKDSTIIGHLVKNGYKVINLSPNPLNMEGCITTLIPFTDMPKYLSAADIAILWRDDTFMNNSASPSKFSEFASMGLYVIHNRSVAVATDFIAKYNTGVLCNDPEAAIASIDIESVKTKRQKRCEIGQHTFSVQYLGQSYINTYHQLCGK